MYTVSYPCENCGKVCKTPGGLKLHISHKHKAETTSPSNSTNDEEENVISLKELQELILKACDDLVTEKLYSSKILESIELFCLFVSCSTYNSQF